MKKIISFAAVIIMAVSSISGTKMLSASQKEKDSTPAAPQIDAVAVATASPQPENNPSNGNTQKISLSLPDGREKTADADQKSIRQSDTRAATESAPDNSSTVSSAGASGENKTKTDGHEHKYKTQTMKPTSRAQGYTLYVCEICGFSYRDNYTDALSCSHNWRIVKTVSATYDSAGYTLYECTECGQQEKRDIQQQLSSGGTQACGHYVCSKTVIPATCTSPGYTLHECLICRNYSYRDEETPALGHDWGEGTVTQQPTCLENGVRTYTCQGCGEIKTEAILALGHSWNDGEVTKKATCSDSGVNTFTCRNCGATRTEELPILAHDWDDGVITVEPTCSYAGIKTYTCRISGETRTEELEALPHTIIDEIVQPTEMDGGYTRHYCSVCGYELEHTDFTDPLTHEHHYELSQEDPTCTEDGVTVYVCSTCGDTRDRETLNALGHDYEMNVVSPTPEGEGYIDFQCSRCGDSYRGFYIPALIPIELTDEVKLNPEAVAEAGRKWLRDNGLEISEEATTAPEWKTISLNAEQEVAESMAKNACFETVSFVLAQCRNDPSVKPVFNCVCREQDGTGTAEICCAYALVINEE